MLSDPASERAVLSSLLSYGDTAYTEISDIISINTFTIDSNIIIYKCLERIFQNNDTIKNIDIALMLSTAQELGLYNFFDKKDEIEHLKAIREFYVDIKNLNKFAIKIKKLEIARSLYDKLGEAKKKVSEISGSESIGSILSIAEDTVLDISHGLDDQSNLPIHISHDIDEYLEYLISNPVDQAGISTGFPVYDQAIGGGLRKGTVNVIAARPKTGKTLLSDNMGFHIANNLKIPVLNMDTEMTKEDHIHRILAMMTEIEINSIETGKFNSSHSLSSKIKDAAKELKDTKLFYKSIAGKSFEEQISIMKRWLIKEVGLNDDGTAKDCVIFYDYLKLMDTQGMSQDLKEYQLLGFMMTALHNFATKYKIPIVSFIQLNRDGITKESTDTASGSDRIIWLCSNFSIFKKKTDEEIAEDGAQNGNRKLIPIISRHGGGLDDNDYINCLMKGWCAKITEGATKLEISSGISNNNNNGFIVDDANNDNNEIIKFV